MTKIKVDRDTYQNIFDGKQSFLVLDKDGLELNIGDMIVIVQNGEEDRYMRETVTALYGGKRIKDGCIIVGFAQPERVQIVNVRQSGTNNIQIGSVKEFNLF